MGRKGGVALREARGPAHFKVIGSNGGHATVSRYGTGYMALIGSAGAMKRAAQLSKTGRTNEMAAYGVPQSQFRQELDRHITGNWGEDSVPVSGDEVEYEPFEIVGGYPPYPPEDEVDPPAEGDEVDYPEQDCPDDDCTDYDAQDPYDMEYDVP